MTEVTLSGEERNPVELEKHDNTYRDELSIDQGQETQRTSKCELMVSFVLCNQKKVRDVSVNISFFFQYAAVKSLRLLPLRKKYEAPTPEILAHSHLHSRM